MKFRKFTATIALTAVLSSSIASSLTPLTVYATDGETVTAETASEEPKDSEPVQEDVAPAEALSEPAAESVGNKVEEPKKEEPAPEKKENEASNDGSGSPDAESADKEEPKTATKQGTSGETTGESGTDGSANEESKKKTSEEETSSSEASSEASGEAASEPEEGNKDEEKTYTLSFESLCGDESLGSGSVSLKLSNDYITIESGTPSYPDYELVSTEVAGYTLSDGKLSGVEDAESVLEGGANVTFRFRSTKPEETSFTLHAVARDTDGNEIRKLSDLSYSLKRDETKELSAPSAADFAAETDEEKITYSYVRTEVDGAERNTVTAADDGKTVSFIYKKETAPKEITVTVHRTAKDTDGNVIADLDDTTLTLKKGESKDLQVPGADTLPKDKKNVSYKYVRTEVNGKETSSVNSEQKESTAVFYYDKITAVTLKQEAVDTDGKRIEKLDDLKAELKGPEARELKAPEAKKFDTEDAEQKITYTYEKTLVDGKEVSKVTAADDGKTITYVYKKTAADKKTKVTLKQEAVDTEGNRIKKLDALTLELKKDEKKTLKAPDAKSLLDEKIRTSPTPSRRSWWMERKRIPSPQRMTARPSSTSTKRKLQRRSAGLSMWWPSMTQRITKRSQTSGKRS